MPNLTKVFTDFKALIETALSANDITGWLVAQNYNPVQGHFTQPVLIMHRVRNEQYGAVGQHYDIAAGKFYLKTTETLEVTIQVEAIAPRDLTGSSTWEANDVIEALRRWMSGPFGTKAIRTKGYALAEKIRVIEEPTFVDENETFEYNPNMQVKLFFTDVEQQEVPALDAVENQGIKGE